MNAYFIFGLGLGFVVGLIIGGSWFNGIIMILQTDNERLTKELEKKS